MSNKRKVWICLPSVKLWIISCDFRKSDTPNYLPSSLTASRLLVSKISYNFCKKLRKTLICYYSKCMSALKIWEKKQSHLVYEWGRGLAQFFSLCGFYCFLRAPTSIIMNSLRPAAYRTTRPSLSQRQWLCIPLCAKVNSHRQSSVKREPTEQLFGQLVYPEHKNQQKNEKWWYWVVHVSNGKLPP